MCYHALPLSIFSYEQWKLYRAPSGTEQPSLQRGQHQSALLAQINQSGFGCMNSHTGEHDRVELPGCNSQLLILASFKNLVLNEKLTSNSASRPLACKTAIIAPHISYRFVLVDIGTF